MGTAGAGSVIVATTRGAAEFPSVRVMVEAELRGWLPVMGVVLAEDEIQRILEAAENGLAPYVTAHGRVRFDMPAHLVTALRSA